LITSKNGVYFATHTFKYFSKTSNLSLRRMLIYSKYVQFQKNGLKCIQKNAPNQRPETQT